MEFLKILSSLLENRYENIYGIKYMVKDELVQSIENYITTPNTDYAVMLNGAWGVGKSYFMNNFIEQNKSNYNFLNISLNGINSIDEIKNRVISNFLIEKLDIGLNILLNNIELADIEVNFGLINKIKLNNLRKLFNTRKTKSIEKKLEDIIVVFDDLERINIDIKECFGYISAYFLEKGTKIILISNENEINNEKDYFKEYKKIKEKVVQYTYDIEELIDNDLLNSFSFNLQNKKVLDFLENDYIIEYFRKCSITNLRFIRFILDRFISFFKTNDYNELQEEDLKLIFKNFLLFSNEYKKETTFNEIYSPFSENIFSVNVLNMNTTFNGNKNQLSSYIEIFDDKFYLFPSIFKFVYKNYRTENFKNEFEIYTNLFANKYLDAMNNLFNYSSQDDILVVIKSVEEGIKQNRYFLNNLYDINRFLFYISDKYEIDIDYQTIENLILESICYLESSGNLPTEKLHFFDDEIPENNKVKCKIFEINTHIDELSLRNEISKSYIKFKTSKDIEFQDIVKLIGTSRNIFNYISPYEIADDLIKVKPAVKSHYSILIFNEWLNGLFGFSDLDDLIFEVYDKLNIIIDKIIPSSISNSSEKIRATNLKNYINEFLVKAKERLIKNENYYLDGQRQLIKKSYSAIK